MPWKNVSPRAALPLVLLALALPGIPARHGQGERYDVAQQASGGAMTATTRNWAGYIISRHGVTSISGTWAIPVVPASDDERSSSTWIGIGGAFSSDLIQVGTAQDSTAGGLLYAVWFETLPNIPTMMQISVHPGDQISASIKQTGTDTWAIDASNLTNGQSDSRTLNYHSSLSSAEWIVETPMNRNGAVKTLANFGQVHFSSAAAAIGSQPVDPADAIRVTMTDGHRELVRVNSMVSGGFDAYYVADSR